MGELRVLVADDHRAFADAVAMRLSAEPDVRVTGVTSGKAAEAHLRAQAPDVLVTDIQFGGIDGMELLARVRRDHVGMRVIVLSSLDDPDIAVEALRLGAVGFMTKDTTVDDLVAAIRGAVGDETWVAPRLLTGVLRELLRGPRARTDAEDRIEGLTPREREVLECMVAGLSRAATAAALFLSTNTVRTHTQRVLAKLGVHSSLEAVAVALRAGVRPYGRRP